jgi:hypothetical protein
MKLGTMMDKEERDLFARSCSKKVNCQGKKL